MAQPEPKRRKTSQSKASKIEDLEWESHKSVLTDLYVNRNKTVDEIHKFMLDNHNFMAKYVLSDLPLSDLQLNTEPLLHPCTLPELPS